MTGATGAIYGIRLLEALHAHENIEVHLVLTRWAEATIAIETPYKCDAVKALADHTHAINNQAASISSGSFIVDAMVVVPCSMKSIAAIRTGMTDNLLIRAADVTIKENRKLILVPRETPLNQIHLENMLFLSRMGVEMIPPMPAFYNHPSTVDDIIDHTTARILDHLGIHHSVGSRWGDSKTKN